MSLGNLDEIFTMVIFTMINTAKQEQRRMGNMLENFIDYNPVNNMYKIQRIYILSNVREFNKGRKEVLIAFEENMLLLPRPYVFVKNEWK